MFLITLDRVSNLKVLKEIYLNIGKYKLGSIIHINNSIDLKTKNYNIPNVVSDFLTLDLKYLKEDLKNGLINIDEIEDCLYDLAELNKEIVLKNIESSNEIFNLIETIGIEFIIPENLLHPKLNNFNEIDTNTELIIYDFFDKKHKYRKFYEEEFSIRLNIDNNGNIIFKSKPVSNILFDGFKSLFEFKQYGFDFWGTNDNIKELNTLIGNYIYDPHFFLIEDINYEEEIIKLKTLIFNEIKEVEPDRYSEMKQDILYLFNSNNYIKLSDIKKIIYSNDKVLNLLKL